MKINKSALSGAVIACAVVSLLLATSHAKAKTECSWAKQPDGTTWGTCVDDNGKMFCVSCPASTTTPSTSCPVVSCSSQ